MVCSSHMMKRSHHKLLLFTAYEVLRNKFTLLAPLTITLELYLTVKQRLVKTEVPTKMKNLLST